MKTFRTILLIGLMAASSGLLVGCATTSDDNNVSSIPWNRPQSWEGSGQLGGFMGANGAGQ
ncbi:MAG TPA: hypothetical protein VMP11_12655 [Verrucomicrobiae bacterium]|nr:hypothetical protein [Verrucomicrobiae bacterium]